MPFVSVTGEVKSRFFFAEFEKYGDDAGGDNQCGSDYDAACAGFLENQNADDDAGNWLQCAENGGTGTADEEDAALK